MANPLKISEMFTPSIQDQVCELIAQGKTLKEVSDTIGICTRSIWKMRRESTTFEESYLQARELSFEIDADKLKTIFNEFDDANKARVMSDNLKWLLSRRAAAIYGDRMEVNITKTIDLTKALVEARKRADIEDAEIIDESPKELNVVINSQLTPQSTSDIDIFN